MTEGMAVIPTREQARWMLERLTLIREFEERLKWLVENGRARGRRALLHRSGGSRGRDLRRAPRRRLDRIDAPWPRALHRQGRRRPRR